MEINNKLIDQVAVLAKLEFENEAKDEMREDLQRIVSFVEKLSELDTEGVEPLIYLTDEVNRLREDEAKITVTQAEALSNAPKKDSDYFKVPKVISK